MNRKKTIWRAISFVYIRNLHLAMDFFTGFKNYKDITFCRPVVYTRWLGVALVFNLMLAQLVCSSVFMLFGSWFTPINGFNVLLNMTGSINGINKRMVRDISWCLFAGIPVACKMFEPTTTGTITANGFNDRLDWLNENVPIRDWTLYDEKGWYTTFQRMDSARSAVHLMEMGITISFLFKRKRDAMMFKLVFGAD